MSYRLISCINESPTTFEVTFPTNNGVTSMKKSITFFSLFLSSFVFGQSDTLTSQLDEITISANKYETPTFRLASSVTVITEKEIKEKQSNTIVDLLREIPGLTVAQQGGTGKLSSIFMRGSNSNFVLVMVDNVEVNDPSSSNNGFDYSSLQVSDIQRIEVVKGPQSTLYGSNATSGIINILTKSGQGKPSYSIRAEGGSNNHYFGTLSAKGESAGLGYFANISRLQTKSISSIRGTGFEKDGYLNNSIFTKLDYEIFKNHNLTLSYKYINSETDLDQSEKNGDDPNFKSDFNSHLINFNLQGNYFKNMLESSLRGSYYKSALNAVDEIDKFHPDMSSIAEYDGDRFALNWQNNFRMIDKHLFTLGIDSKIDRAKSKYHSESMWGPFDSNFPEESISTTGVYIQDFFNYSSFSATIGTRLDYNNKYGSVNTYRVAPVYFIESLGTKLKATYGTGFKAPSLFNLFAPFYGNSELDPEESSGWDIGFEQYFLKKNILFGVTYFDMKFENMIGYDENFISININKAESRGIEAIFIAQNIYGFSLNANYTFNETFETSLPELSNIQLIRRPKHQFSMNLDYAIENISLGLLLRYSGERFDNDFSTFPSSRVSLKPYTLLNIRASYKFSDYVSLFGRIENLLNEEYEDILYYGTIGRAVYAGFQLDI